jgi:translocation and assembly module TamB
LKNKTALDIKIMSSNGIKVRGRGVNAAMSLNAHVTGAFNDPKLAGKAEITRGRFDFLGKRFVLNDSRVIYNDAVMNSRLDVSAIRETADLTATVKVTGTITRPEISLESTPSLPEDEVLSRILFGRSASQLTTIETARLAAALAQLSGGSGFDLLGGLENALGRDTLDFGQSQNGQTQLTTGKYLSDDVYVEVRSSAEGAPGLAVEWTPKKNISLEAETAPGESQRVSIQWQKDFD